jgi:hypothetical protein
VGHGESASATEAAGSQYRDPSTSWLLRFAEPPTPLKMTLRGVAATGGDVIDRVFRY